MRWCAADRDYLWSLARQRFLGNKTANAGRRDPGGFDVNN